MLDSAPIVVYIASLVINLGANHSSLVIYLVATVGAIILIKPCIIPLVPSVSLVKAYSRCAAIPTTIVSLKYLVIRLQSDSLALTTYRISSIAAAILIKAVVFSLIATIPLITSHAECTARSAVAALQILAIDLGVTPRQRRPGYIPWRSHRQPTFFTVLHHCHQVRVCTSRLCSRRRGAP